MLKKDKFVTEYLRTNDAESKKFKHESIPDEKKTLLGSIVTANDIQEEFDRNSSILINIVSVKPITLSSNYEKKVLEKVQAHFQKQFISKKNSYTEVEKLWFDSTNPKRESKIPGSIQ
ncbi:9800_t:CDS:2 [Dentiscutata heterogama]|uniref:9800_t:CDS:1 n=1 Tax=Dentiscutata heterogama TaxID=1316150 RepID=A0ACA9KM31_9GLOM|nr:9800_t:CDS:2 [Dentiscutata heterogama]